MLNAKTLALRLKVSSTCLTKAVRHLQLAALPVVYTPGSARNDNFPSSAAHVRNASLCIHRQDFTTQAALYTHHQYIAGFLMVERSHAGIFWVRDYDSEQNKGNVLDRVLKHKEAIISHLSWVSLFLGFHTLGLYVHNVW